MKEILVTYQPNYRSNAISCIISIPSSYTSAQERLDAIQKAIQMHYWRSLSAMYKHGMSIEQFSNMSILLISDLNF